MDEEALSQSNQQPENQEAQLVTQVQQKKAKKPRRPLKVLKIDDYTNKENGLKLLYEEVKAKKDKFANKASLHPEKALQEYISLVKEWSFNLAPKYSYDYFMDRTQAIGRKKEVTDHLEQLREYHKNKMHYNPETKEFDIGGQPRGETRVIISEADGPQYVVPPSGSLGVAFRQEDRPLERLVEKEDLDYSIKKKVKMNEESKKSSTSKMDVEL